MADGVVGGGRSDGGGRGCTPNRRAPVPQELDVLLSKYVLFQVYLLKAVTGAGYLAFTWSTVVLLGGFITALTKKDFWCITVISFMQAARIFHDQLLPNFFKLVTHIIRHNRAVVYYRMWLVTESFRGNEDSLFTVAKNVAFFVLAVLPFLVIYVPAFLYVYGAPVVRIALAIWRTVQRDYGEDDGDSSSKANLAPALDIFYSLVLLQGGLLPVWLYHESWWVDHLITLRQQCKLPNTEWCRLSLVEFLCDTRERSWRDLSSIRDWKLVDYAVSLLDSGWWDDNLSGARLLNEFIRQGADVRSLLLPSRPKIQKLIDSLGWRDGRRLEKTEMRKLAARIVAHLAGDLHLAQFPGAIQCISYLLQDEATLAYSEQQGLTHCPQRRLASEKEAMILRLQRRELEREARRQHGGRLQQQQQQRQQQQATTAATAAASQQQQRGGGGSNELIVQGLVILERLASDRHNCSRICSSPGLLHKIMAPLYSGTMVQDINVVTGWVHVVSATFKVVYQLIHAPGKPSTRLRAEISKNKQAMSNLNAIIIRQEAKQELKMRAMDILTELTLDSCIYLPWEMMETLKNSLDPLVRILDDDNIEYRMIAGKILENMCVHCDKQRVKEILLPKVLSNIMSSERENTQSQNFALRIPAPGQDVENQNISTQRVNEGQTATKALQAKLLSLILVIYVNVLETADFGNALQNNGSAFVAKLKTMVEENCQATVGSLSIVKLCGQIAVSMLQHKQYTEHFKNQEFVNSLSEARKIMSNLESCALFAGRDHGLRKMARPLLLDLEEEARGWLESSL